MMRRALTLYRLNTPSSATTKTMRDRFAFREFSFVLFYHALALHEIYT